MQRAKPGLVSRPVSGEEDRKIQGEVEAALVKRDLGEPLTDHEWMLVQYASQGRVCHVCHVCGGSAKGSTG